MAITFERDDNNPGGSRDQMPPVAPVDRDDCGGRVGQQVFANEAVWGRGELARGRVRHGHAERRRQFRAVLDESGKPISVIGDTIGEDPDQTKRWKDRQAVANDAPTERNNNGRRERWNGRANGGQARGGCRACDQYGQRHYPRTPEQQAQDAAQAQAAQIAAAGAGRQGRGRLERQPANIPYGASGRRETHRARDERLAKEQKEKQEAAERAAERNRPTSKQTVRGRTARTTPASRSSTRPPKPSPSRTSGLTARRSPRSPRGAEQADCRRPPPPQIVLGASQDAART